MKTILKYISLLMISGLMIPLYQAPHNACPDDKNTHPVTTDAPVRSIQPFHFSFMHDVGAKVLPVISFFK